MNRDLKRMSAAILAASMVPAPLPAPPASMFDRGPSGKDRSKIKAARKQSRKTRRKSK